MTADTEGFKSMLGKKKGVPSSARSGVDGQINTGHMKHKDSEEMLSGVTLFEVYSHTQ